MDDRDSIANYKKHIEKLEIQLHDAKQKIDQCAVDNAELVEAIEESNDSHSEREIGAIGTAMQFIDFCQKSLDGQHLCGPDGCTVDRRELLPEEAAAFSAACDMLGRVFDGEFQLQRGVSPEANEG